MSTLRKVGAFLGLVPDDARYDGAGHEYAELADNGDYPEQGYYDGHGNADGDAGSAYSRSEYVDQRDTGVSYDVDYAADPFAAESADDHQSTGAYAGYSAHQHQGTEYQSATADHDYAYSSAPAEASHPRQQSAADSRPARRSSKRGKPAHSSDYQVRGSLAVQPDVRLEAPAEITGPSLKPATITLNGFADARDVGETYRKGQAVILDMTDLTDAEARRMVDFAAGLAFAVRGSIDKVTTKVFMLHPPESDVSTESGELAFASH